MEQQITPKTWLLSATLDNWYTCQEKGIFGCSGNPKIVSKIRKNDNFVAFAPKIGFIGKGKITGEYYVGKNAVWEDKVYPNRFSISTNFITGKILPAPAVVDDLTFVTNKSKWGVFFRTAMRNISDKDFEIISQRFKESKVDLEEIDMDSVSQIRNSEIGDELHNKVESLFREMGFVIADSNFHSAGPDITVEDPQSQQKCKILIQCKNSEQTETITVPNLDKIVHEYSSRVESQKAKLAILVFGGQKLPKKVPGEPDPINLESILRDKKVAIWTDETVSYYEDLLKKISHFARYQLVSDLGLKLPFEDQIELDAVEVKQNGKTMYLTSISPQWLLKTASVVRRIRTQDGTQGYQRLLDSGRVRNSEKPSSIANYLEKEGSDWMFPNAIVLATTTDARPKFQNGKLKIESKYGQFWVIDGQHRLFAFANAENARLSNNKIICVIIDSSTLGEKYDVELAQVFVDLNGRAKKVSKALLFELYPLLGSNDNPPLDVVLKLIENPLFRGVVCGYSDVGSISLVTFASTPPIKKIYKFFQQNNKGETQEEVIQKTANYLLKAFKLVSVNFSKEWADPESYFLKTDRGIRGILRIIFQILEKYGSKVSDLERIFEALKKSEFDFSAENAKGIYLGENGADVLAQHLSRRITKEISDFSPDSYRESITETYTSHKDEIPEKFLKQWISKLEGDVRCVMMFIDETTVKYLSYLDFSKVKEVQMFFGNCLGDEKKIAQSFQSLRNKGLKITLTQSQKRTIHKGGFFHGRWIGDSNMQIDTAVDLKDDSQRGSHFYINVFRWKNPPELDDFKRYWDAAETSKEISFGFDWGK